MNPPHGLPAIVSTFGDIRNYIDSHGTLNPSWETVALASVLLPFPLPLSWDLNTHISRIRCHHLLVPVMYSVFQKIVQAGLQDKVTSFGGCFQYRPQRTGSKLSTHSWGIALDINPTDNEQGTSGNMNPLLVELFKSEGFEWGGDWDGRVKDPMHFQFCSGY